MRSKLVQVFRKANCAFSLEPLTLIPATVSFPRNSQLINSTCVNSASRRPPHPGGNGLHSPPWSACAPLVCIPHLGGAGRRGLGKEGAPGKLGSWEFEKTSRHMANTRSTRAVSGRSRSTTASYRLTQMSGKLRSTRASAGRFKSDALQRFLTTPIESEISALAELAELATEIGQNP